MSLSLRIALLVAYALIGTDAMADDSPSVPASSATELDRAAAASTVSPAIASMITAGLPKYDATQSSTASVPAAVNEARSAQPSSATIVRLPAMIVRDRKLPDKSEILTKQEMTKQRMDTYIGPENGLDRGFLNLFTVADLWHHLPILGHYELAGFETNEERGLRLYKEAKRREEIDELNGLSSLGQKAHNPAPVVKPADK
jgi:hypothetical protein